VSCLPSPAGTLLPCSTPAAAAAAAAALTTVPAALFPAASGSRTAACGTLPWPCFCCCWCGGGAGGGYDCSGDCWLLA
jgi:hypothetical protein